MANPQVLTGAALGLGIAMVVVLLLTRSETDDAPRAAASLATATPSSNGGPAFPDPRPGPNRALARLQAAGEIDAKARDAHRSKMLEAADGFADKAPMLKGPPPGMRSEPPPPPPEDRSVLRPKKSWPLDRDGIQGAVRESIPDLRECYDAWVKLNPTLGGRVIVTFKIDAVDGEEGGKVVGATLKDQGMGHAPMEGCIVQVFEELRFQRPEGGSINVTYPLDFSAGERDAGT